MSKFNSDAKNYRVACVTLRDDGWWGVNYWGDHAEQGGIAFTLGNAYSESLGDLLRLVQSNLEAYKEDLQKMIAEKGTNND